MNEQRIGGDIRTRRAHDSAHKHVAGSAVYVDDITTPEDTLVVLIGQSPHAHAAITAMDLAEVAAADGVVAVLTHKDIPGTNDCRNRFAKNAARHPAAGQGGRTYPYFNFNQIY